MKVVEVVPPRLSKYQPIIDHLLAGHKLEFDNSDFENVTKFRQMVATLQATYGFHCHTSTTTGVWYLWIDR